MLTNTDEVCDPPQVLVLNVLVWFCLHSREAERVQTEETKNGSTFLFKSVFS